MIKMLGSLISNSNIDVQIFYLINLQIQNPVFDFIMPIISELGYFTFWIILVLLIYFLGGDKGKSVAVLTFIALVAGYFITEFLKYIVARPRPFDVLQGVRVLAPIDGYSWPSGHAVASFIAATIIGREYGWYYFFIFAFLVAFSRIYNGVHYPSDVVSGALIGILIALVVVRYENQIMVKYNGLINYLKSKRA